MVEPVGLRPNRCYVGGLSGRFLVCAPVDLLAPVPAVPPAVGGLGVALSVGALIARFDVAAGGLACWCCRIPSLAGDDVTTVATELGDFPFELGDLSAGVWRDGGGDRSPFGFEAGMAEGSSHPGRCLVVLFDGEGFGGGMEAIFVRPPASADVSESANVQARDGAGDHQLFTDIVKSTNLVETLGDEAWDHLLRWHDETLRSQFRSYGGEEVNRIGDGFFVSFAETRPAVERAVAIQRVLLRHRREHGFSPQVRIGVHEAEAARIGAVAGGGEIVVSASVAEHLPHLTVIEPRSLTLRGLSDPVEVVSIQWQ